MTATLQDTPAANRIHIGIYGRRNSGKSSLLNAFTGQAAAIVSAQAGTTTDPVKKAMEIQGLGPCVLIDTAGFDDEGTLGQQRIEKTRQTLGQVDIALLVLDLSGSQYEKAGICACDQDETLGLEDKKHIEAAVSMEKIWYQQMKQRRTVVIPVINKADLLTDPKCAAGLVKQLFQIEPVLVSAKERTGLAALKERMLRALPEDHAAKSITGQLAMEGDAVLLVMPQDIQAPKGRLILPQVQTIRELLDKKCIVTCVTTDKLCEALDAMPLPPKLIITDSQAFASVYEKKPQQSLLTSFSILFAAQKGDIDYYVKSAASISQLTAHSRVLIAECCTHAPMEEDIGRVKLPRMLRKRYGEDMEIEVVSGMDFPEEVRGYDLIIQCGGCMFNRSYVMSRIERARAQGVPMTNYGVAIAYLTGILDKVAYTV